MEQDPDGQIFFYSWYLDVVCDHWDGLVAGDYEAVFAIPYRNKLGIKYIIQPYFTRTLDICSSQQSWKSLGQFIDSIPEKFRLQEFCILPSQISDQPIGGYGEKTFQTVWLNKPFHTLKKAFSTNTLQNLKKAEKNKLRLTDNADTKTVCSNFKKIKGKDLTKFGAREFKVLQSLMDICYKQHHGYTKAVISTTNEIVASAFFMQTHNRITYLKGSTTEEGKKTGAMHFLMAGLMEEKCNQPLLFDFGGSTVASLARFFKGFGGTDNRYYTFRKNNLPLVLKWLK